jgi:hypothetical protein
VSRWENETKRLDHNHDPWVALDGWEYEQAGGRKEEENNEASMRKQAHMQGGRSEPRAC